MTIRVKAVLRNAIDRWGDILSPEAFDKLAHELDPQAVVLSDGRALVEVEIPENEVEAAALDSQAKTQQIGLGYSDLVG